MPELLARHRAVIPSWVGLYYGDPIEIVSGKGCRVADGEGRSYPDFFAGILYLIRNQVELAEKIVRLSGIPDAKVCFTNSGTEANEVALLAAVSARHADQVLAMRGSYRGRSFGAVAVTGNPSWKMTSHSPFCAHFLHGTDGWSSQACVADLRGLLISDEVQTGWGRTGEHFWGIGAHGVVPDAMTFAKGLGNGFAIGGVVARGELLDGIRGNGISTFGGNPLSTAAANATLDYLLSHDLQRAAAVNGGSNH